MLSSTLIGRGRLPRLRCTRRRPPLPARQPPLRAPLPSHHHQPALQALGHRLPQRLLRRRPDRPPDPPRGDPRHRRPELPPTRGRAHPAAAQPQTPDPANGQPTTVVSSEHSRWRCRNYHFQALDNTGRSNGAAPPRLERRRSARLFVVPAAGPGIPRSVSRLRPLRFGVGQRVRRRSAFVTPGPGAASAARMPLRGLGPRRQLARAAGRFAGPAYRVVGRSPSSARRGRLRLGPGPWPLFGRRIRRRFGRGFLPVGLVGGRENLGDGHAVRRRASVGCSPAAMRRRMASPVSCRRFFAVIPASIVDRLCGKGAPPSAAVRP